MAFRKDSKEKKEKTGFARLKYGVDEEIWEEEAPPELKKKKKPRPWLRVVVILVAAVLVVGLWMARDSALMGRFGDGLPLAWPAAGGDGYRPHYGFAGASYQPAHSRRNGRYAERYGADGDEFNSQPDYFTAAQFLQPENVHGFRSIFCL